MTTPTLAELVQNERIKGLSFWCGRHACAFHEVIDKGGAAIDYGPAMTLPDLAQEAWCRACYSDAVQVTPNWGEGGFNPFESLGG